MIYALAIFAFYALALVLIERLIVAFPVLGELLDRLLPFDPEA